jgi:leucyl-tRNA synthetase
VAHDAGKDTVLALAEANPNVARHLEGKTIIKAIFVPGRLVNFVAK